MATGTSLLNGTLSLGPVENVESLARRVLDDRLRASNAYLNSVEYDDALSYLVAQTFELWLGFDPSRGSQSFSTYAYRILWRRVPSWYRQRFGDTRYKDLPDFVSFDDDQDADELSQIEVFNNDGILYEQINVARLSPDARNVLERIVEPMVQRDMSLEQIAEEFGYSRRWVSRALERLRHELEYLRPAREEEELVA